MEVEFDSEKDAANQAKHGLSLTEAAHMDFATAVYRQDTRYDYGEARFQILGMIEDRLHMLVFTMRDDVLRAISLRKANPREERRYGEAQSATR